MIYLIYSAIGEILQKSKSSDENKGDLLVSIVEDATGYVTTTDDSITPQSHIINLITTQPEPKTTVSVSATMTTPVNVTLGISGLPECNVALSDTFDETEISDGTLDFTADLGGDYTLVFSSPLYLDTTSVITVTD